MQSISGCWFDPALPDEVTAERFAESGERRGMQRRAQTGMIKERKKREGTEKEEWHQYISVERTDKRVCVCVILEKYSPLKYEYSYDDCCGY